MNKKVYFLNQGGNKVTPSSSKQKYPLYKGFVRGSFTGYSPQDQNPFEQRAISLTKKMFFSISSVPANKDEIMLSPRSGGSLSGPTGGVKMSEKYKNYFWNQCFDKGRLKNFILWFFTTNGYSKAIKLVEELKTLGFEYATKAGISLGIEDLKIPPKKVSLIFSAENETSNTVKQYTRADITGVERFQRLIDTWHRTSEQLKQEVIDHFESTDILNPVYMMAFSGARGNISQVRQLVGMRGLMSDPQGQIIDFPIRSNFREGLTLTEYIISSYGARKGIVDTALRTANAGYLTRRLVDVAQHVIISSYDCGTKRGIFITDMKEGNKTIVSLQTRLIGRVLSQNLYIKKEKLASRNDEISIDLAFSINKNSIKKVFVRSPLTCETKKLVCQLCYGWSLAQGNLVSIGEAVGVIAGQSIGEPGTQLTMRTFHTGGVFAGDISDLIRMPFTGIIKFNAPILGTLIRTPEGKISFLTKGEGSFNVYKVSNPLNMAFEQKGLLEEPAGQKNIDLTQTKRYKIPAYTLLFARNGEIVSEKEIIAQISSINRQKNATDDALLTIKSELEGQLKFQFLELKETKVGPKVSKQSPDPSLTNDSIFSAWSWGNAWILSGKIYELSTPSIYFPKFGDYLNRNSYINANNLAYLNSMSGLMQLDIAVKPLSKFLLPNLSRFSQSGYPEKNGSITKTPSVLKISAFGQSSSQDNGVRSLSMTAQSNKPVLKTVFLSFNIQKIYYKKFGYFIKLLNTVSSNFSNFHVGSSTIGLLSENDTLFGTQLNSVGHSSTPQGGNALSSLMNNQSSTKALSPWTANSVNPHKGNMQSPLRVKSVASNSVTRDNGLWSKQGPRESINPKVLCYKWYPSSFQTTTPGLMALEKINNLYTTKIFNKKSYLSLKASMGVAGRMPKNGGFIPMHSKGPNGFEMKESFVSMSPLGFDRFYELDDNKHTLLLLQLNKGKARLGSKNLVKAKSFNKVNLASGKHFFISSIGKAHNQINKTKVRAKGPFTMSYGDSVPNTTALPWPMAGDLKNNLNKIILSKKQKTNGFSPSAKNQSIETGLAHSTPAAFGRIFWIPNEILYVLPPSPGLLLPQLVSPLGLVVADQALRLAPTPLKGTKPKGLTSSNSVTKFPLVPKLSHKVNKSIKQQNRQGKEQNVYINAFKSFSSSPPVAMGRSLGESLYGAWGKPKGLASESPKPLELTRRYPISPLTELGARRAKGPFGGRGKAHATSTPVGNSPNPVTLEKSPGFSLQFKSFCSLSSYLLQAKAAIGKAHGQKRLMKKQAMRVLPKVMPIAIAKVNGKSSEIQKTVSINNSSLKPHKMTFKKGWIYYVSSQTIKNQSPFASNNIGLKTPGAPGLINSNKLVFPGTPINSDLVFDNHIVKVDSISLNSRDELVGISLSPYPLAPGGGLNPGFVTIKLNIENCIFNKKCRYNVQGYKGLEQGTRAYGQVRKGLQNTSAWLIQKVEEYPLNSLNPKTPLSLKTEIYNYMSPVLASENFMPISFISLLKKAQALPVKTYYLLAKSFRAKPPSFALQSKTAMKCKKVHFRDSLTELPLLHQKLFSLATKFNLNTRLTLYLKTLIEKKPLSSAGKIICNIPSSYLFLQKFKTILFNKQTVQTKFLCKKKPAIDLKLQLDFSFLLGVPPYPLGSPGGGDKPTVLVGPPGHKSLPMAPTTLTAFGLNSLPPKELAQNSVTRLTKTKGLTTKLNEGPWAKAIGQNPLATESRTSLRAYLSAAKDWNFPKPYRMEPGRCTFVAFTSPINFLTFNLSYTNPYLSRPTNLAFGQPTAPGRLNALMTTGGSLLWKGNNGLMAQLSKDYTNLYESNTPFVNLFKDSHSSKQAFNSLINTRFIGKANSPDKNQVSKESNLISKALQVTGRANDAQRPNGVGYGVPYSQRAWAASSKPKGLTTKGHYGTDSTKISRPWQALDPKGVPPYARAWGQSTKYPMGAKLKLYSVINNFFNTPHLSSYLLHTLDGFSNSQPLNKTTLRQDKREPSTNVRFYVYNKNTVSPSNFARHFEYSAFEGELINVTSPFTNNAAHKATAQQQGLRTSFSQLIQNESTFLQIKQHTSLVLTKGDMISFNLTSPGAPRSIKELLDSSYLNQLSTRINEKNSNPTIKKIENPQTDTYIIKDILIKYKKTTDEVLSLNSSNSEVQSSSIYKIPTLNGGSPEQTNKMKLGEFFTFGDCLASLNIKKLAVTKSGQIIHLNRSKITLRKGQAIFISPKSIVHKYDGDFINPKAPVITLSYQRLKTGDIVQGIPKIEQFFEARTTKRGRLFRDSLPNLLKALFKTYLQKLPLDKAVRQSFYKIQQIIVDGVLRVYRSQGVTIADKHLEIIVKQMTSKVRILEGGQTGFFPGEVANLEFVEQVNELLINPVKYEPIVLGITKSSLEVDSFLSAASFQQTTRVLSSAAISRKKDFLKGLKENVILGNLIPAGTGFLVYLDTQK